MREDMSGIVGFVFIGGLIILSFLLPEGSGSYVDSYVEPDHDAIVESDEYLELESELEDAKYCIESLKEEIREVKNITFDAEGGDYETLYEAIDDISWNLDEDTSECYEF